MTPTTGENAVAPVPEPGPGGLVGFIQSPSGRNYLLMAGVAAVLALMVVVWMWSRPPEYRVLFTNFSDRDAGSIVAALQQMNVPYKLAEGGGAILVPAGQVHDVRFKLAAQGLPKGGTVGFELMENQKLGISQFLEQVNFQRALEGELARSIQSVAAVQSARVHLALPKNTVFVRDQQKPTASVLLNLHGSRSLDEQQVSAIVHLVASSVPDLPTRNVTVVDQNGNLLSENGNRKASGLDPNQLKYVQELQQNIVRRIESIITPIVGQGNVRAEATADVDFSHVEQAAEIYSPNQPPNAAAVRSQQSSESRSTTPNMTGGVPGALTNQPPVPATAPLVSDSTGQGGQPTNVLNEQKDATVNYEVDKTVRYVQQGMGGIRRLSVAVVVNYKRELDADGKLTSRALTEEERTQITDLVREAMGFNRERGDSLNVVNSPFAGSEPPEEIPLWQRPEMIDLGITAGRYLLAGIVLLYLYFAMLRPLIRRIKKNFEPPAPPEEPKVEQLEEPEEEDAIVQIEQQIAPMGPLPRSFEGNLTAARELARNDPKLVASVVKTWVGNE